MLWYKRSIGEWVNGELVLQKKKNITPIAVLTQACLRQQKKDYAGTGI